ncbi:MAG: hypothetical protein J0L97_01800 [Alphaproteobacteria bacterium]|nr:hypothetical protein [Alphaproteobacteria bacterium]
MTKGKSEEKKRRQALIARLDEPWTGRPMDNVDEPPFIYEKALREIEEAAPEPEEKPRGETAVWLATVVLLAATLAMVVLFL